MPRHRYNNLAKTGMLLWMGSCGLQRRAESWKKLAFWDDWEI
jgi:hypothetical protein